jgi:hypothetical protein
MALQRTAAAAIVTMLCAVPGAHAQDVRGFVSTAVATDSNHAKYPAFGGGVIVDAGQPWVSVGGQGEALVSWPYVAGRGALFAQGNLAPKYQPIRPFLLAGYGFGEETGTILGGGVEVRSRGSRLGLRLAIEDHMQRPRGYNTLRNLPAQHQVGFRFGILF